MDLNAPNSYETRVAKLYHAALSFYRSLAPGRAARAGASKTTIKFIIRHLDALSDTFSWAIRACTVALNSSQGPVQ